VKLVDARGARRSLTIADVTDNGCWAEAAQTTYVVPGTMLRHERGVAKGHEREAAVGELPRLENAIRLQHGDLLVVTRDSRPGRLASVDSGGRTLTPATIGCTLPEVFQDVRSGEAIWFDDGKIGGVMEKVEERQILVRITQARAQGAVLRAGKGINLPDTSLRLEALTAKDLEDLSFVAHHADVVELSFANCARDVELLQLHLARLGKRQPAIVLKIETRRGFENLPDMLLTAMRASCCGVMIARGDLAVECGFERLAEVQEEILWICEAAHVPVIWATQVLETLAKEGLPSRAEITDAAMGHRAECVMLNKGPRIINALQVLDGILRRMQSHQAKKHAMLRELRLAHALPGDRNSAHERHGP
jgi:pyruvate kinase